MLLGPGVKMCRILALRCLSKGIGAHLHVSSSAQETSMKPTMDRPCFTDEDMNKSPWTRMRMSVDLVHVLIAGLFVAIWTAAAWSLRPDNESPPPSANDWDGSP